MRMAGLKALPNSKKFTKREIKIMTIPKKLDWMTEEQWQNIEFYWGCVCGYDTRWDDLKDYEGWCKRVLAK